MFYESDDLYKSYKCRLFGLLGTFFSNGKLSIYVNMTTNEVHLSIYNNQNQEPIDINGIRAVDCVVIL